MAVLGRSPPLPSGWLPRVDASVELSPFVFFFLKAFIELAKVFIELAKACIELAKAFIEGFDSILLRQRKETKIVLQSS